MAYVDHSRAKLTKSAWEMLPVSEALDIVLGEASPLAPVPVLLAHALGCVCAKDVVAASPFPPFRASVRTATVSRVLCTCILTLLTHNTYRFCCALCLWNRCYKRFCDYYEYRYFSFNANSYFRYTWNL